MERVEGVQQNMIQCKQPEALSSEGFADEVIQRLQSVRERYQAGAFSEKTPEIKRLEFARWMYQNGKIAA